MLWHDRAAMDKLRLAFFGFRHGHVMGLYNAARQHPRVQVLAACEEHAETAASLRAAGTVQLTHDSYEVFYQPTVFGGVAGGVSSARRGQLIVNALRAHKHVIA